MLVVLAFIAALQMPAQAVADDERQPRRFEVDLRGGEVEIEHIVEASGCLHVWARSDEIDPVLRIEVPQRRPPLVIDDDDSGGGTTALVKVEVAQGEVLVVRVGCPAGEGHAEVHVVASVETPSTRDAIEAAKAEHDTIAALRSAGEIEAARDRVAALIRRLVDLHGQRPSDGLMQALWKAATVAEEVAAGEASLLARQAAYEQCLLLLPPEHRDLLASQLNLGMVHYQLGDLQAASEAVEHVHALRERLLSEGDPALLDAKLQVALVRKTLGDLTGGLELEEQVHATQEELLSSEDDRLLLTKMRLAATRRQSGDLAGALALEEHVHAMWTSRLPPDDSRLIAIEQNLAATRMELGDVTGAHELNERVHAALERLLPPDHPSLLGSRQNLAVTLGALGDLTGALRIEESVHAALCRLLPPDHPQLLWAKLNLATRRQAAGDVAGAHVLNEHVHAARERLLPPDHPDLLAAKQGLAVTRRALGDVAGALELFEHIDETSERLLPPDHPSRLTAMLNLAALRKVTGDLRGALDLEEQVHAARERLLPPGHADLLYAKGNLAVTRRELGDAAGALELEEFVKASWERLLPADHPDLLAAKQSLASTRRELGDLAGALELGEHVYEARKRLFPADHPAVLDAEETLAWSRHLSGDRSGALQLVRSLLARQLVVVQRLQLEAPRAARAAAAEELRRLPLALLIASSSPADPEVEEGQLARELDEALFAVIECLRAVSTDSAALAVAVRRHPGLADLRERLARTRNRLSDHVASAPAVGELSAWRSEVLELVDERDALERELRRELDRQGLVLPTPSVEGVARALDENAALVSFLRHDAVLDGGPAGRPPRRESLLALVVTPDGRIRRVDLGPVAPIAARVERWRAGIGKPVVSRGRTPGLVSPAETAVGRELREALLDPALSALVSRPERLHIVLDDVLHLLPLEALPAVADGLLGDELDLRLEVSVMRLLVPAPPKEDAGILLALGGIDFEAEGLPTPEDLVVAATPPSAVVRSGGSHERAELVRHGPLPETLVEVRALAALHEALVGGERLLLTEGAASKQALFEQSFRTRYLHVATHGWFADETIPSLGDGPSPSSPTSERTLTAIHRFVPGALCGLALAGANRGTDQHGKVPGILTAEELAALDLSGCELAVLSACETNVGLLRAGQGIQSLQAALHAAGVRTAITSLWKVDDAATRRLFDAFYTGLWKHGLGKAEALRRAKRALREGGHPVQHWAAWVLTGETD